MKYLIDEALIVESHVHEEINEASGSKEKNYYIQGVFSTPGQKNRNGRIYPMNIWEREVAKYQEQIKNNSMNTLGEWEHPSRTSVDPLEAVMKIVELKMDNGLVVGKAKILNNNSPKTNQLKALIDEGYKIGVSSRGTGTVRGDIVENFSLTTYDAVSSPSDYNANLQGLCESLESSVILDSTTKPDEIKEPIVEAKKELTLDEKKKLAEEFVNKFSKVLDKVSVNEAMKMKVNSKLSAIQAIQMSIAKISDENAKSMLNAALEFLSKEFDIKLNESSTPKAKFKYNQVVQFYNNITGKKQTGIIIKVEHLSEDGEFMYYYDIEGTDKLYKETPEADIIKIYKYNKLNK